MKIAVLGLGLIGGSLAQALHPGHEVVGTDPAAAVREQARAWGLAVADDVAGAVAGAELVVLAAPVPGNDDLLARVPAGCLVTDVGGVKLPIVRRWEALDPRPALVPGHPMTGAEQSGWAAARPDLFAGARWVLCPGRWASPEQWLELCEVVLGLGAVVVPADPAQHDVAAAAISHAPHAVAAALAAAAGSGQPAALARSLGARSFRDLTRVSASPPERTAEFCVANRTATAAALRDVIDRLGAAVQVLEQDDPAAFAEHLREGHDARAAYERAHDALVDDSLLLGQGDDWAVPLLALAQAGGVVVAVDRRAGGIRLDVRRPA